MSWCWRGWSTLTPVEVVAFDGVQRVLLDACATARVYEEEFIALGWPERIKPVAVWALGLMRARGRCREDREEDSPSISD